MVIFLLQFQSVAVTGEPEIKHDPLLSYSLLSLQPQGDLGWQTVLCKPNEVHSKESVHNEAVIGAHIQKRGF